MIYADFHIHTTFSSDSIISPKMLVERLHAHPLVKVAAVTDHGTVAGIKPVQRLAVSYPDLLIIPGVEITTWQGDIVVLELMCCLLSLGLLKTWLRLRRRTAL
jgi:predicted metal-dependent phosphoesterase TrpH